MAKISSKRESPKDRREGIRHWMGGTHSLGELRQLSWMEDNQP